jgi:hypothetical protein
VVLRTGVLTGRLYIVCVKYDCVRTFDVHFHFPLAFHFIYLYSSLK